MRRVLGVAFLAMCVTQAQAMTIESYRAQLKKAETTVDRELRDVHRLGLTVYYAGVADSIATLLRYQNRMIMNQGEPFICVPKTAHIDAKMIESVMLQQLNDLEPLKKLFGPEWDQEFAFQLAFVGLWRTFPCK